MWTCIFFHFNLAFLHIFQVLISVRLPPIEVVKSVVAYAVIAFQDLIKNRWVLFNVMSHTKKRGMGPIFFQLAQYIGCHFRNRPVIKSEVNGFVGLIHLPGERWIKLLQPTGCFVKVIARHV